MRGSPPMGDGRCMGICHVVARQLPDKYLHAPSFHTRHARPRIARNHIRCVSGAGIGFACNGAKYVDSVASARCVEIPMLIATITFQWASAHRKRQTRCESGTQSHGAHEVSRAAEQLLSPHRATQVSAAFFRGRLLE